MNPRIHFKLYKSGKNWCCMAIAALAAGVGITFTQTASASQQVSNDVNTEATVDNVANSSYMNNEDVNSNQNDNNTNDDSTDYVQNHFDNDHSLENTQNGWNNDHTNYYVNGSLANGYLNDGTNNYMFKNGQVVKNDYVTVGNGDTGYLLANNGETLTGVQQWAGGLYYFNPTNGLKVNNQYVTIGDGTTGYLFGNDGRAVSGVQQWAGTYYYFDPSTLLKVNHDYVQSQWGDWYMFGEDGRIVSGIYDWQGGKYYFDLNTYLRVDNDYRAVNDGTTGYLLGNDGRALSGVQKWAGTYYYFDPSTSLKVNHDYVQSQWGNCYMFGDDGRIVTGVYDWQGCKYYFDPATYLKVTNKDIIANGVTYHANGDGILTVISDIDTKVNKALSVQGTPYVWGGNKPGGFDCSGLVQWAYGLGPNYRTTYQQTNLGTHHRDVYNAPKGALLFFGSDSAPYHVAISLGSGKYVHAPEPGDVVKIGYTKYFTPSFYITMN